MENKRYVIYKDKKSVGLMDVGKIDADCNLDMFSLYSDKEGIELMEHELDSICCHLNEQWETIQEQKREITSLELKLEVANGYCEMWRKRSIELEEKLFENLPKGDKNEYD